MPRERYQVLSNVMDDFEQLLYVHGTARGVESGRTLSLEFRERVADASPEQLAPLKTDAEVTDAELAAHDVFVLGGVEDNALVARLAQKNLLVEPGRRFFRWRGQTYGGAEDGLAVALPNPWNPKRTLYLYLANSGLELWHMTRAFKPGNLQGWALFKGGEVRAKGYHDVDALAVELPPTPPTPRVAPLTTSDGDL